jgi:MFS family permease
MIVLGSIFMILFVLVEWKWAKMPMMPLHLFKNPAVCAIIIQNFCLGIVYYAHLYFLPVYYQNARQFSPVKSALLTIPFVAGQAVFSILSGQYISRLKRYGEVIWTGYSLWALGSGLTLLFNRSIQPWAIVLILLIEGAGVGFVFQPTLVAAQAHSATEDRAVVISVRNFARSLGGALGLALSSAIVSNVLASKTAFLPDSVRSRILASTLHVPDLSALTEDQKSKTLDAYMAASHAVFIAWLPLMSVCLLLCFLIKDRGLQRPTVKTEDHSPPAGPMNVFVENKLEKETEDV